MTPLFLYLLKVNIALALFYLAYHYGLRRLTFYSLNRFYLLFAIVFSSLYPLIDLSAFVRQQQVAGGEIMHYLPDLAGLTADDPLGLWNLLAMVFWSGVAIMGLRFLVQSISLVRLHLASRKSRSVNPDSGEPAIRIIREKINPFSFFRSIYINPLLHNPAERASIIGHEQVHVRQWHTFDILAGELNRIFYWFNPGAWLMMVAIRENLEFIADRRVLKSGVDAKTYQYSLVKVSEIPYASALANNFNFSHLKIRITMMDKRPSAELHLVKYLVLVPFVAATALAFNVASADNSAGIDDIAGNELRIPAVKTTEPAVSAAAQTDTIPPPEVKEVRFGPAAGKSAKNDQQKGDKNPTEPEVKEVRFGPAVKEAGKADTGKASSMPPDKVVIGYPSPEQAEAASQQEKTGKTETSPEPQVTAIRITDAKQGKDPLVIVDGEPAATGLKGIDAADIASVSVLKDDHATSLYGKKGENGVILITSKENAAESLNQSEVSEVEKKTVPHIKLRSDNGLEDALYIVDGEITSAEELEKISPDDIFSIDVLKGESATKKYGEKGKSGAVEITTKE